MMFVQKIFATNRTTYLLEINKEYFQLLTFIFFSVHSQICRSRLASSYISCSTSIFSGIFRICFWNAKRANTFMVRNLIVFRCSNLIMVFEPTQCGIWCGFDMAFKYDLILFICYYVFKSLEGKKIYKL